MTGAGSAPETEAMAVLNLNLRFGLADDGPNRWECRSRAFAPLLAEFPCDFYAFQEANDFQIAFLAGLLPDHGVIGQRRPAPPFWQNSIIFFHRRWQCLCWSHFFLSPTPDLPSRFRQSRWPRQCTMGLFGQGRRRVVCISTHFDFAAEVQVRSAEILLQRLQTFAPQVPTILMGDFNAGPQSACYQVLVSGGHGRSSGFCNAFAGPCPGTHHGFSGRSHGEAIDWILYQGLRSVRDGGLVARPFKGIYPSDHFPLTAGFGWTEAAASARAP